MSEMFEWPSLEETVGAEEAERLIDQGLEELRQCFADLLVHTIMEGKGK